MSKIAIEGIKILAISTTVPPKTNEVSFQDNELVKVRNVIKEQTTSDLGFASASRIIKEKEINIEEIGVLIFLSRTPDYRSPNTAAILQGRLGLPIDCICYDINGGANSFSMGIQVASSILKNINKDKAIIIFGDTPSKLQNDDILFNDIQSDATTCILLQKSEISSPIISYTESFGEDFDKFAILQGGFRYYQRNLKFDSTNENNFVVKYDKEFIPNFIKNKLPQFIETVKNNEEFDEDSLYFNSDINLYFLGLNNKLIRSSTFGIFNQCLLEYGLTYSSSIPLQLDILAANLNTSEKTKSKRINSITFGEGLVMNYLSFEVDFENILPTKESLNYFEEYRISHEI